MASTGAWSSPFAFSLLTPLVVAGLARGFVSALAFASAAILAVGLVDLLTEETELRSTVQWVVELLLVALVAGYAKRILGERELEQSLALSRIGQLADANELLFSLHRVAQALPASLDLDEALDSTIARLRDLFDYDAAALLVLDETDGSWVCARRDGVRLAARLHTEDLPRPLQRALALRSLVYEPNLLASGGPGLAPRLTSGLYAVLPARGAIIGLLSVEHAQADHYSQRDQELLTGFVEPAALAVDNARWFGRLRTVGAEEERNRIARDLHDRIGQSLAYLAFELDRIVKSGDKGVEGRPAGRSSGSSRSSTPTPTTTRSATRSSSPASSSPPPSPSTTPGGSAGCAPSAPRRSATASPATSTTGSASPSRTSRSSSTGS